MSRSIHVVVVWFALKRPLLAATIIIANKRASLCHVMFVRRWEWLRWSYASHCFRCLPHRRCRHLCLWFATILACLLVCLLPPVRSSISFTYNPPAQAFLIVRSSFVSCRRSSIVDRRSCQISIASVRIGQCCYDNAHSKRLAKTASQCVAKFAVQPRETSING